MAQPLSFGANLDDEQRAVAEKVWEAAQEAGVDPRLALSIAYQESNLRPNVKKSKANAIGIMQITPSAGKDLGLSPKELQNEDINIHAGISILKSHLDKYPDDPRLAVVAYNAGPNHAFFEGGVLPKETEAYLRNLHGYGAFDNLSAQQPEQPEQAPGEQQSEPQAEPTEQFDWSSTKKKTKNAEQEALDAQEVRQAQLYGGTAGTAVALRHAPSKLLEEAGGAFERGRVKAQATAPTGVGVPVAEGTQTPQERIMQGRISETGTTGRQNMSFNDITSQRANEARQQRELMDELTRRGALPEATSSRNLTRVPIVGSTPSGVVIPASTSSSPMASSPAKTALEEVTGLLRRLAQAPLVRYGVPGIGGAMSAGEAVRAKQAYQRGDIPGTAIHGAGALGGLLSMHPATAAVGIPLSMGAGALDFARQRAKENAALGTTMDVVPSNPMGDYGF